MYTGTQRQIKTQVQNTEEGKKERKEEELTVYKEE